MIIRRFFQRAWHLWERIVNEGKRLPGRWKIFGPKVALETFLDVQEEETYMGPLEIMENGIVRI